MAWVEKHGRTWRVRYWKPDGTPGTVSGFATEEAARNHATALDASPTPAADAPPPPRPSAGPALTASHAHTQPGHAGHPASVESVGPAAGNDTPGVLFRDWMTTWWTTIDVGDNTAATYRSLEKNHLLPRWGDQPLTEITPAQIAAWFRSLHDIYKPTTVASIRKLLSLVLADAVNEGLLTTNPARRAARGRRMRHHHQSTEKVWADEHDVHALAARILQLAGPNQALLVITAAYTGMRWGELAGLRRDRCHLIGHRPHLRIDPDTGALHEVNGQLEYGPPKTASSARDVTLPPFLAHLLAEELKRHRHPQVFTSVNGKHLRRSCFGRRIWIPAVNGTARPDGTPWKPLKPGLTFHGLRHSHKTWMIEDGIPDVLQARRLGHRMDNKINDVYSHVADTLQDRLLDALQARWNRSLHTP